MLPSAAPACQLSAGGEILHGLLHVPFDGVLKSPSVSCFQEIQDVLVLPFVLPHPEVAEYFRRKANDYDRWLRGMRRLQDQINSAKE